jgi:hypothetical protein
MPEEIDFGKGVRGLHHIPTGAKVILPESITEDEAGLKPSAD